MAITSTALKALLLFGLGGALLSSSVLAGATLLLAVAGIAVIRRGSLYRTGWDTPKELRLLHFAFWFFVLVSAVSWALEGFSYEGGKTLGTHARFLLFWPLIIAFSWIRLGAATMFLAIGLTAVAAIVAFAMSWLSYSGGLDHFLAFRFGGDINPIMFGNIALLGSLMVMVGSLYFWQMGKRWVSMLFLILAIGGLTVALFSETRSNLITLPLLLLLLIPLMARKVRILGGIVIALVFAIAVYSSDRITHTLEDLQDNQVDNSIQMRLEAWQLAWQLFSDSPWSGAGLGGYTASAKALVNAGSVSTEFKHCCTNHAHNDLLNVAATRGMPGVLSWAFLILIPLTVFGRQIVSPHRPTACLGVAGTMMPVAYVAFGLTEATLDRSLFLTFYLLSVAAIAAAMFTELRASYYRQRGVKVSATVIAMNEENHMADCLKSARLVADEIIVLDSGSSDRTVEIARQYADVVEVTDWPGFGIQKQRALDKATGDWVLSLDADERITPELAREINHHLAEPDADAYKLPWAVTIYGKRLDFGRSGRAPLRLFRREGVRFSDALVHERILIPEGRRIKTLRGRLTHYTHRDFGHSLEKSAKYAWLGSLEKHRQGKKTRTMIYPTVRGLMTFIQVYFIRFGFLDGAVGYLTAVTYGQVTFNKYAGLWTLDRATKPKESQTS